MYTKIGEYRAERIQRLITGKATNVPNDEDIVYPLLKAEPQKKEAIVNDVKHQLAAEDIQVSDELAEQITTGGLENLKNAGKAENTQHGYWKKV